MRTRHIIGIALLIGTTTKTMPAKAQDKDNNQRPTAYMVSDAHLDTQWNWDIQATLRHHIRVTLEQNLMLMRQFPHYVFNFEGAVKYAWMKEYYPQYWAELTQRIQEGRWHLAGSSWDANEVIICSPESWIRNILLGQTFYRQEFGTESTDVFLPDCFGFPYYLPTAAAHCGLIGFSSQKLAWRAKPFYEGGKKYPFSVGLWQGIDGSRIMMTHGFGYGQRYQDQDLSHNRQLLREIQESPLGVAFRYYGTGDTGGSPDLPSVRAVERGIQGDGPIRIISAPSDALYKHFLPYEAHPELPVFDGELPMDLHGNGCYTSQAAMKVYNRQLEHLGDAAERAAVMADWMGTQPYPIQEMTRNWQRMIWHQFHDDLTGTSIPRAYEFSWNDELIGLKRFSNVLTASTDGIATQLDTRVGGQPLVLYNAEAFDVRTVAAIDLPNAQTAYSVRNAEGKVVRSQVVTGTDGQAQLLFEATLPPTGYAVYSLTTAGRLKSSSPQEGIGDGLHHIANSRYTLTVNANGDITSITDSQSNRELIEKDRALRLVVFDQCSSHSWPAWEIQKATLDVDPVPIHEDVSVSIVENGPLRHTLRIDKRYGESRISQFVRLYEGTLANRIDFYNEVDWHSPNALLKCEMPLSVWNEKATYDIGLGCVERGNNCDTSFEVYSHEWTDLTDRSGAYGVTVANDSRYGWDKPEDNTLRLSLLYSPQCGNGYRYQATQDYGFHQFTYSLIGHQGGLNVQEAVRQSTTLNSPVKVFRAEKHKGRLGRSFSFVSSDNSQVLVRTLKRAEVTDEYVVRVHEIGGKADQTALLTFPGRIVRAVKADGTEKETGAATFSGSQLTVNVKRYGLATYKVVLQKPEQVASKPTFQQLPLTFDRYCATYNEYRAGGSMDGQYSFAAELLPADHRLVFDGVPFTLGEYSGPNGHSCHGDTLTLPEGTDFTHLYLLAASNHDDRTATFTVGASGQTAEVPFYSGFIGQWGHEGQTKGYLKTAHIAYIGTHRHSTDGDEPYEFTYLFRLRLDIPKGARTIVLPNDPHIILFAATAATDTDAAVPAAPFFITSNKHSVKQAEQAEAAKPNLLAGAKVISATGFVNAKEAPEKIIDGDTDTKWCDVTSIPNAITFDLGSIQTVREWRMLNAAGETPSYVTRGALLMGRQRHDEEWHVLDILQENTQNQVKRQFQPADVRYLRLLITAPNQEEATPGTRIYELEVF